jgi:hypothetical protein
MTGKTISGYVATTVTLGANYTSPLTITSSGVINPSESNYSSTGIYLPASKTIGTILNHGAVYGGIGGYNNDSGRAGGIGILLDSAGFVSNTNRITGGAGDSGNYAGAGGIAVDVLAFSTISNSSSGVITGGTGGYGYNKAPNGGYFYGAAGVGGAAVDLQTSATFNNAGAVNGGAGGSAAQYTQGQISGGNGVDAGAEVTVNNSGVITGGGGGIEAAATTPRGLNGGVGVLMDGLGKLINSGAIIGGAGGTGANVQVGGYGNLGVYLFEATATNTGVITGGAGGSGSEYAGRGGVGIAVYNYASLANNKGNIIGGAGGTGEGNNYAAAGGAGGYGVFVSTYGTVNNTGHITGGAGGYGSGSGAANDIKTRGGNGGLGVYLASGKLTNSSAISGGNGGSENGRGTTNQAGGAGGIGIATGPGSFYARGNASIINYGAIRGGNGGNINGNGGNAGVGGAGVSIADATLTNHGTIIGGYGGNAGQAAFGYGYGGAGGAGVVVGIGGKVNNIGTVIGGGGGSNIYVGTVGGAGVYILGGTFIDTGTVTGGAAGFSQGPGTRGDAVLFGGTIAGTLMAGPGAKFNGNIVGTYGFANVIELTGSSSSAFAGVGVSVTGISDFSFATGAARSLEGSAYGLDFANIAGLAVHDTIIVDGFTAILKDTTADPGPYLNLMSSNGSTDIGINRATAKELLVTDAGGKTTITAAMPSAARAISSTQAEFVGAGANATSTTIKTGGFEEVYNGGTASATTIAGGELLLNVGATAKGGIAFTTITGGDLVINSVVMPTTTISGFIAGDTIQLAGIAYNASDKVTVGTAGTVTISTPGISYKLDIAGATVGETDFKFSAGSVLTKTTAQHALTFISAPPELTTSGTSLAPHFAGENIFLADARHQIALERLSSGASGLVPTPASAGILAAAPGFRDDPHGLLIPHLS